MAKPIIEIHYCPGCNWLPRSTWMAQELLTTFSAELGGVTLVPAETSGLFCISVEKQLIWDRKVDGGFPSVKELKQRVRGRIVPDKGLGHLDR